MWISSYCIACIYQQNKKVKQLFSLVTYEESESPAMKHAMKPAMKHKNTLV